MNSKIQRIMNRKNIAIAALMLLMPLMMGAQTLKGSYFLDNSLNRNKLNPAFAPQSGYWQIPVIGNTSVGLLSNLDLQTFLYPMNGQLYTFLNQNVSLADFDKSMPNKPHFDVETNVNLLNFGWRASEKSFWTVDLGLRVNADIDIPRDLFMFMKKGTGLAESTYNIGAVHANVAASVQAALGYSRDLSDLVNGLRVGGKARVILPVAYAGLNLDQVSLSASPEKWNVQTEGYLHTAMKGLDVMGSDGKFSPSYSPAGFISGFGYSFDLGAEYTLEFDGFINGVSFSAAVTDLGLVHYSSSAVRGYETTGQMDWTGLRISLEEGAMNGVVDELKNEAMNLTNFTEIKGQGGLTRSTLPNFYVGAEMPFLNNMMSVGALYSARKSFNSMRNELTLSYNLNPVKWFALGVNYSFLNVAKTMGWILEFTPKAGPCFYIGSDYMFMEMAKAPETLGLSTIPTSWRFNLHFGLAVAFGGKDKN